MPKFDASLRSIAGWLLATVGLAGAWAQEPVSAMASPSAAEIVAKNAAARGGVDGWSRVQTMAWGGHVESPNALGRAVPFQLEQKRPDKARFEIFAEGQKAVRAFDGASGWKLRPDGSGRPEVQPYSAEELKTARDTRWFEGPLMAFAARGASIRLGGLAEVEGRKAYVLDVKLTASETDRVWVDAETFLEVRHDRESRNAAGQTVTTTVFYRDYRTFDGLKIPLMIETAAAAGKGKNRLVIDRVALNPPLDDSMFERPSLPAARRHGVVVDARGAAASAPFGHLAP